MAFVMLPTVPYANVLWSVGVEEQFYLVWPWLVKRLRQPVLVGLTLFLALRAMALVLPDKTLAALLERTRFSCMLIGAGAAYLLLHRQELVRRFTYTRTVQLVSWAALIALVAFPPPLPYPYSAVQHEVLATFATVVMINISQNPQTLVSLRWPALEYLGKLSYGIYVFHLISVTASLRLLKGLDAGSGGAHLAWGIGVDAVALGGSVVIAAISYHLFESRFLRMKARFSSLLSGDLARGDRAVPPEVNPPS